MKTLVEDMKQHLPIPARPTREIQQYLRTKGIRFSLDRDLMIVEVFDSGDMGGIMCAIHGDAKQPVIISITHLRINPDHPLSGRIRAYQEKRIKCLSRHGNQSFEEYEIKPKPTK